MENVLKRYKALRNKKNFEKLSVEFLIFALAKNMQYIFLVYESLNLLGIVDFRVGLANLPRLSLASEWAKVAAHHYNPLWIYYRFLQVFLDVALDLARNFVNTIMNHPIEALIISIIIVNIWLLYSKLSFGYSKRDSKRHNIFKTTLKKTLFTSTLLERSLWMIFLIDIAVFITTPKAGHIIFLLAIYLLILSIKATPLFCNMVVNLTERFEKSFFRNEKVLMAVTFIDIALIYLDSKYLFTLFMVILLYCGIAQLVFKALKDYKKVLKWAYYALNLGILIFFFGILSIYFISFAVVNLMLLPVLAYYLIKKRKMIPVKLMELLNTVILLG
ncbi:hypothetical protein KY339_05685, partial [Candidatus Woesearchaeota archaeon]|nr:hypothetical protein [Candidatus Woesearchaeota archaeon]